jgi:hypothetical protein
MKTVPDSERMSKLSSFLFGPDGQTGDHIQNKPSISCIIHHRAFKLAGAFMVILNAVVIGIEVQFDSDEHVTTVCSVLSCVFTLFFTVELLLHVVSAGFLHYLADDEPKAWKAFEILVVAFSIVDSSLYIGGADKAKSLSSLKAFKLVRVVRVFRVLHFFRSLAQLAAMMTDALKSMMSAVLLIVLIIYVFGLSIAIIASKWIKDQVNDDGISPSPHLEDVQRYFGDLLSAIYILFQSVFGGVQWHYVSDALLEVGFVPFILFLVYIFFMSLAGLNVITGLCTDNALRYEERNRSFAVEKELEQREQFIQQITDLFHAVDGDNSGTVTVAEMEELLSDESLSAFFRVLGFDISDATTFLRLLDADSDGALDIKEFLQGCVKFRGPARNMDIHILLLEQRRLLKTMSELIKEPPILEELPEQTRQTPGTSFCM